MPAAASNLTTSATISNAEFQAINTFVSGSLDAGMPKTADSGQINPAAANFPGSAIEAGFEMRRMDDALQATHPVFVRLGYRRGASADAWALGVTIGEGSDGAGAIVNPLMTENIILFHDITSTFEWNVSCDEDRMLIVGDTNSAQAGLLSIERTVDPATKTRTSKGILLAYKPAGAAILNTRELDYGGSHPTPDSSSSCKSFPLNANAISDVHSNSNIGVKPVIYHGLGEPFLGTNLAAAFENDFPNGNLYSNVTLLGAVQAMKSHRYTAYGNNFNNPTNGRLLYRFD